MLVVEVEQLPVLQTFVHDVFLIRRLQVVPPGEQHRRGTDGPNHQVERLLQVHLTWRRISVRSL